MAREETNARVVFVLLGLIVVGCLAFVAGGAEQVQAVQEKSEPAGEADCRSGAADAQKPQAPAGEPDSIGPELPETAAPGDPIGCAHDPQIQRVMRAAGVLGPEVEPPLEHPAPFDEDWLTVAYGFDSREDTRNLSFEGHSRVAEDFDVAGQLDIWSSLDHDPSRFSLRSGLYGRIAHGVGLVAWLEEFTGSSNSTVRFGAYRDVGLGGAEPFCRLVALPLSSEGRGPMARAVFDVALYRRWSLGGFAEVAWDEDEGTWIAAEPELRYAVRDGLWATLEYRRDERWEEPEGLAVGVRASL